MRPENSWGQNRPVTIYVVDLPLFSQRYAGSRVAVGSCRVPNSVPMLANLRSAECEFSPCAEMVSQNR